MTEWKPVPKGNEHWEKYYRNRKKRKTNADRIRAMTDEELANEILSWFNWLNAVEWDDNRILDWLKEEVKNATDTI